MLPEPYLIELQKLCDAAPPFPTRDAISTIERELGGQRAAELLDALGGEDTPPVAAATLGQVRVGTLRSQLDAPLAGPSLCAGARSTGRPNRRARFRSV